MKLSQILKKEAVVLNLHPKDKWDAIEQLTRHLQTLGAFPLASLEGINQALIAREKSMSTGMEKGIAIPHVAVDGIEELGICLGVVANGVPFESMDGQPASILVLLLIPRSKKMNYIRTLAEVARLLSQDNLRKKILGSADADSLLKAIREEEDR